MPSTSEGGGQSPGLLSAFSVVAYGALDICVFGYVSLLADVEVIDVGSLAPAVGPVAVVASAIGFGVALWLWLRDIQPALWGAFVCGVVAGLTYVVSLAIAAVLFGGSVGAGVAAASSALLGWTAWTLGVIGCVVAGAAIVVRRWRPRPDRPRRESAE